MIHIILDGGNGTIDGINPDGTPSGDDDFPINNNFYEMYVNGYEWYYPGGFYWHAQYFIFEDNIGSPDEPVANCEDNIFLRIYNASDMASATKYCNVSVMQQGLVSGSEPSDMLWLNWEDSNWIDFETAIDYNKSISLSFSLTQNYPNPFNPETKIDFEIRDNNSDVSILISDIKGRLTRKLIKGRYNRGKYSVIWDGKDDNGKDVGTGIYFYQLKSGKNSKIKKMLLLK